MEMNSVNNDLVIELYQTKRLLKAAEEKLKTLEENRDNIRFEIQVYDLNLRLKVAEDHVESKEREIFILKTDIDELNNENMYLREQNQQLSNHFQQYLKRAFELESIQKEPNILPEPAEPEYSQDLQQKSANAHGDQLKTTTIAMKLKLCKEPAQAEVVPAVKPSQLEMKAEFPKVLRIFVGHLNSETDENTLKEYFGKYGEIADIYLPVNAYGQRRGFAFVTFTRFSGKHPMETPVHIIKGCRAYLDSSGYDKTKGVRSKTLMASGIIQNASDQALLKHFSKFGKVIDIHRNKESNNKFARWAFITFSDFESVDKALEENNHLINGHGLDCRRALDFNVEGKISKVQKDVEKLSPRKPLQPVTVKLPNVVDVLKLHINNLKLSTTNKDLKKYFSKFGTVYDSYIPTFYGTKNSKGYGYVVMPTKEVNFSYLHHIIDGNPVHITEDHPNHLHFKSTTLLVSAGPEILAKVSEKDLEKFFSVFGKIKSVRKPHDPATRTTSHYAFVEYNSEAPVEKAIENHAYIINGNILCVTKSRCEAHKK